MKYGKFIIASFLFALVLFNLYRPASLQLLAEQDLKDIAGQEIGVDTNKFTGPIAIGHNTFKWYREVPHDTLFIVIKVSVSSFWFDSDLVAFGSYSRKKELSDFPMINNSIKAKQ